MQKQQIETTVVSTNKGLKQWFGIGWETFFLVSTERFFLGRGATKVSLKLAKNEPCTDGFATNVSQNTSEPTNNKQTNKRTNKQASKQASKQTSKQTNKQANKQANKQTSKQSNKQASKQTNKQTNKTNKNNNYSIMRFPN
jgi:ATPase subunit of ABC transporter with duplicated ATPase domains